MSSPSKPLHLKLADKMMKRANSHIPITETTLDKNYQDINQLRERILNVLVKQERESTSCCVTNFGTSNGTNGSIGGLGGSSDDSENLINLGRLSPGSPSPGPATGLVQQQTQTQSSISLNNRISRTNSNYLGLDDLINQGHTYVADADQLLHSFETQVIKRCFNLIELQAQKRKTQDGFNRYSYALGVLNVILIAYCFGKYPQHFWLLYVIEGLMLFPQRWVLMSRKRPCESSCWLDLCWVYNFIGYLLIFLLALPTVYEEVILHMLVRLGYVESTDSSTSINSSQLGSESLESLTSLDTGTDINNSFLLSISQYPLEAMHWTQSVVPEYWKLRIFQGIWSLWTGPLVGAAVVLNNALIFHDINNISSTFIHVFPVMVMYCFRWHHKEIIEAWPKLYGDSFQTSRESRQDEERYEWFDSEKTTRSDLFLWGMMAYFVWAIPFSIWMLMIGLELPKKGKHTTVFNDLMKKKPLPILTRSFFNRSRHDIQQRRANNDWEPLDYIFYILGHAFVTSIALFLSPPLCFQYRWFHMAVILILTLSITIHGANRYAFYILKSYQNILKAELQRSEEEEEKNASSSFSSKVNTLSTLPESGQMSVEGSPINNDSREGYQKLLVSTNNENDNNKMNSESG